MTTVVATDLDRTLIWSASAAGGLDRAFCVEDYLGKPLSYVASDVVELVEGLLVTGRLVPVTTRTEAQYRRINLPGGPAAFAVCLNGGRILVDNEEDLDFRAEIDRRLRDSAIPRDVVAVLERWAASVRTTIGSCRVRDAEGLFLYAVFDSAVPPGPESEALTIAADELGWQTSVQGRKVYLVPRALTKEAALTYLETAHGVQVVATAGDSVLDLGMLDTFGPGWVPRDSELHRSGSRPPTSTLTNASGIAAGAEIITAMVGRLDES
jgi:hydroxymethylpyrimidine pyrophosphatase-like HAD family hydrolase